MTQHYDHSTTAGTLSGTVLTVASQIESEDYLKTIILASVGAIVSFSISLLLKWLLKKFG